MNQLLEPTVNSRLDYMTTTDNKIVMRYTISNQPLIIEVNKHYGFLQPTFKVFNCSYPDYIFEEPIPQYTSTVSAKQQADAPQYALQLSNYSELASIFSKDESMLRSILYITLTFLQ